MELNCLQDRDMHLVECAKNEEKNKQQQQQLQHQQVASFVAQQQNELNEIYWQMSTNRNTLKAFTHTHMPYVKRIEQTSDRTESIKSSACTLS